MDLIKASRLLLEEFNINGFDRKIIMGMITHSDVPLRGLQSIIPMRELLILSGLASDDEDSVHTHMEEILKILTDLVRVEHCAVLNEKNYSVSILANVNWQDGSEFVLYKISANFLKMIKTLEIVSSNPSS